MFCYGGSSAHCNGAELVQAMPMLVGAMPVVQEAIPSGFWAFVMVSSIKCMQYIGSTGPAFSESIKLHLQDIDVCFKMASSDWHVLHEQMLCLSYNVCLPQPHSDQGVGIVWVYW